MPKELPLKIAFNAFAMTMTTITIDNFRYFLEDLEKNLREMEALWEQITIHLRSAHVSYGVMSKICENWSNQLEHQK